MPLAKEIQEMTEKTTSLQPIFRHIAQIYDRMSSVMSFGFVHYWRWRASRVRRLKAGETGLDLGTGTADFALALLRASGRDARLIGIDYAPEMVTIGRLKLQKRGVAELIELRIGDVEHLDLPDNSVDGCYSAFLIRNPSVLKETMEMCGWHDVHYIHLTGGIATLHIGMKWADRTS